MMPGQVLIALWITAILWASANVYLAMDAVPGNTITEVLRPYFRKYPMVVLGLGALVGHTLWHK